MVRCSYDAPWHFLNFFPLPHQQGSFRPIGFPSGVTSPLAVAGGVNPAALLMLVAPAGVEPPPTKRSSSPVAAGAPVGSAGPRVACPTGRRVGAGGGAAVTCQLVECGKLLDIPVYDHVIVAGDRWMSFANEGML